MKKYYTVLSDTIIGKVNRARCPVYAIEELNKLSLDPRVISLVKQASVPLYNAYNALINGIITSIFGHKFISVNTVNWDIYFATNELILECGDIDLRDIASNKYTLLEYTERDLSDTFIRPYNREDLYHSQIYKYSALRKYDELYLSNMGKFIQFDRAIAIRLIDHYIKTVIQMIKLIYSEMYDISRDLLPANAYTNDLYLDSEKGIIRSDIRYNKEDLSDIYANGWEKSKGDLEQDARWSEFVQLDKFAHILYDNDTDNEAISMDIALQITDDCNLRCTYCYQHNKGKRRMPFNTAKKAIDTLLSSDENNYYLDSYKTKCIGLEFVGGDGLMNIDLVDQTMEYFLNQLLFRNHPWQYGWLARISTNGVLYEDPRVQQVLNKYGPQLPCVITVDGSKRLHDKCRVFPDGSGSYDYAINATYGEIKRGVNPASKITLSPENLSYFEESVYDFISKGLRHLWFNGIYEHKWTIEEATTYYHSMKNIVDWIISNGYGNIVEVMVFKYDYAVNTRNSNIDRNHCGGNGRMLAFDPDGNAFNCVRYMKSSLGDNRPELVIGNVNRGIGSSANDKASIDMLRVCTIRSQSTQECLDCPLSANCGYCTAYNYELYGTPNKRSTNICNFHKAEMLGTFYYWGKIKANNLLQFRKLDLNKIKFNIPYNIVSNIITEDEYLELQKFFK